MNVKPVLYLSRLRKWGILPKRRETRAFRKYVKTLDPQIRTQLNEFYKELPKNDMIGFHFNGHFITMDRGRGVLSRLKRINEGVFSLKPLHKNHKIPLKETLHNINTYG